MNNQKGQILFAVVIFLGIIFIFSVGLLAYVMNNRIVSQRMYNSMRALNVAEAGIEKAVWCLNNTDECGIGYTGETTSFEAGQFSTTVTDVGLDYSVTSIGTVGNTQKTIKASISQFATSASASFYYGVQVGAGGMVMDNNSYIDGNIYSNGTILAGSGAYVTGDVYVAGGTALTADQEQITQTADFIFRQTSTNRDIAQSFKPSVTEVINYVSLYLKKVGNPGNATVRIAEDNSGQPAAVSLASGILDTNQVTGSYGWVDVSFDTNPELTKNITYWIIIDNNSDHASRYLISGKHENSGYGNGFGLYSGDWTASSWNDAIGDITFKTWMGGIDYYIDGLTVGDTEHTCDDAHHDIHHGDAYAHQILNSYIECDAYYDVDPTDIAGSTVGRNKIPDSIDPPPEALPISEGKILQWKQQAEEGDTPYEGDYILDGDSESLGPLKITGNLIVTNGSTLTISGNLWVEGDILFENNSTIQLDPAYEAASGVILNDGRVTVRNNCTFNGSGESGSYILALTTNSSLDELAPAINIDNNAEAIIFYAGKGLISVKNGATLKEATGYKLHLNETASVTYTSGLANAKFSSGPGGIWVTQSSTWQELD